MDKELELIYKFVEDNKSFVAENPADKIPDIFKDKYRSYVEILCDKNIELGLLEKAYGSYTGNAIYPQDWSTAEENLLKLVDVCKNPWAANSLGYIYYYGRTNNGVSDYEKALKYFTIAQMAGITEAKYKLCDMLTEGKGFPAKMPEIAFKSISNMYNELLNEFRGENYSCEFADVAVRMGNYYYDLAKEDHRSLFFAYQYYMIAKYALELRMKHDPQYGDESVMKRLLPKYQDAKERFHKDLQDNNAANGPLNILEDFLLNNTARVQVRKLKDTKYKIIITMNPVNQNNAFYTKELVAIPHLDYCKLISKIELVSGKAPEFTTSKRSNFNIDMVEVEDDELNFCIFEDIKDEEEGVLLKVIMRLDKEYLGISKIE